jgi:hypothetical protein
VKWIAATGLSLGSAVGLYFCLLRSIDQGIAGFAVGLGRFISLLTLSPPTQTSLQGVNWNKWTVFAFLCFCGSCWWLWRLVVARFLDEPDEAEKPRVSELDWIYR